jgi:hypothetical protein
MWLQVNYDCKRTSLIFRHRSCDLQMSSCSRTSIRLYVLEFTEIGHSYDHSRICFPLSRESGNIILITNVWQSPPISEFQLRCSSVRVSIDQFYDFTHHILVYIAHRTRGTSSRRSSPTDYTTTKYPVIPLNNPPVAANARYIWNCNPTSGQTPTWRHTLQSVDDVLLCKVKSSRNFWRVHKTTSTSTWTHATVQS